VPVRSVNLEVVFEGFGFMSVPFADAFCGRRVFVTGHTGFKGSWLSIWLHRLGARVTGYGLAPYTDPSNFIVSGVEELLERHHEADIRDADRLAAAMKEADPDVVFHLAAQPIVRRSYEEPRYTIEVNTIGTCNVLEAVRALDKPVVVICITSDKCYENVEQPWGYRENDEMGGYDPYSASKGAAELVISAYRRSYFHPDKLHEHGVKVASVRAGNVIGGGDWSRDRILVDVASHLARGEAVPVRSPHACRPWEHVLEPLGGYLTLAAKMLESDDPRYLSAWNFGPMPGHEMPVSELVDLFVHHWGEGAWDDLSDRNANAPYESGILRLCIDKAIWNLGWRPRWGSRGGVEHAARWYKRHYHGDGNMRAACLQDITDYENAEAAHDDHDATDRDDRFQTATAGLLPFIDLPSMFSAVTTETSASVVKLCELACML